MQGKGKGGNKKTKNRKNTGYKSKQKEEEAWKQVPPKDRDKKSKDVGKYPYHWFKHQMAWFVHKLSECCLGKERKEEQQKKKPAFTSNSATHCFNG
jgi:hypothetical protein